MARRSYPAEYDRPPTVRDLFAAFGFGWAFDLGKAAVGLALLAGGTWLCYYIATTTMTNALQQLTPQPAQQAASTP